MEQRRPPPLKSPGDVINGRYTVAQIIGHGAMGEVYVVADQEKSGELVALKYLNVAPEFKIALDHFKGEFETMTQL